MIPRVGMRFGDLTRIPPPQMSEFQLDQTTTYTLQTPQDQAVREKEWAGEREGELKGFFISKSILVVEEEKGEFKVCELIEVVYMSLCDVVDPLDYEEFIQQHQLLLDRDPLHHVLDFPENDIRVGIVPRKIRTLSPVVPEESPHVLPPHVQDCVQSYTADWVVVNYQFRHHSSSSCVRDHTGDKHSLVHIIPRQEFEVDYNNQEFVDTPLENNLFKVDSRQSIQSADTPRGSWASFDLRNSVNDQLILALLERVPPETVDQLNEVRRLEQRQDMLFSLYPAQDEEERIERRIPAENPCDQIAHRILQTYDRSILEVIYPHLHGRRVGNHLFKKSPSVDQDQDSNPDLPSLAGQSYMRVTP
ncbi:unnamed protein product [Timema podura]|uniref:Dedicator of cytokinesis C/D N-terminal domain-containing protein n=1 Tax=Timema podura TaxID=61482 RepID=A0ABN7NYI1_TIMPD|nr:unnamed protein product [Timema podura]